MPEKRRRLRPIFDNVRTDPDFARRIVQHFQPQFRDGDTFLDPCRGDGAFYNALPDPRDWCEIDDGRDFHRYNTPVTWIITNIPWSSKAYRPIAQRAYWLADNVVFLIRLQSGLSTYARMTDPLIAGHRPKEIIIVDWNEAGFATEGFALGVIHWQREYRGGIFLRYGLDPSTEGSKAPTLGDSTSLEVRAAA
jgi:hypothetical protein